jgi:hypothetical protein
MEEAQRQEGFTLAEVAIVSVVVIILTTVIVETVRELSSTQTYLQRQQRLADLTETMVLGITEDVSYAVRMFSEDTAGRDYLARMDLGKIRPLANSRMPVPTSRGLFIKDPQDTVETGNLLFLVRNRPAHKVPVAVGAGATCYRVDVFQFVVYCLSTDARGRLDINRWGSVPVARYQSISSIQDPEKRERVGAELWAGGVRYTWDPAPLVDDALQEIRSDGTLGLLDKKERLPGAADELEVNILSVRHAGVAGNSTPVLRGVPFYAKPAPGFPHGFELKKDGDSAGGLLLIRLVTTTRGRSKHRPNFAEAKQVVSFREE